MALLLTDVKFRDGNDRICKGEVAFLVRGMVPGEAAHGSIQTHNLVCATAFDCFCKTGRSRFVTHAYLCRLLGFRARVLPDGTPRVYTRATPHEGGRGQGLGQGHLCGTAGVQARVICAGPSHWTARVGEEREDRARGDSECEEEHAM